TGIVDVQNCNQPGIKIGDVYKIAAWIERDKLRAAAGTIEIKNRSDLGEHSGRAVDRVRIDDARALVRDENERAGRIDHDSNRVREARHLALNHRKLPGAG